jgi:hypothetical protein
MPDEDLKAMIADIDRAVSEDEYNLTEWEQGFMKNVRHLVAEGVPLSENRDASLEKIWKKATGQ